MTRDVALGAWAACPVVPGDPNPQTHSCRSISYEERTERAVLWAVNLRTRQETSLWTFPGRVYWFGVSETGAELVAGEGVRTTAWTWRPNPNGNGLMQEWSNPGTVTGCGIRYRSLTSGVEVAPQIATASACTTQGPGTIAPAPPRAASP